jgi:hypothetical protein
MKLFKLIILTIIAVVLVGGVVVRADEAGQDYGYWCTQCGRQHGPGESCPYNSAPANPEPEQPYDWSQPVYAPATATTTTTLTRAEQVQQEALALNKEGDHFYSQGEYSKAVSKYRSANLACPDNLLYSYNFKMAVSAQARQESERADLEKRIQAAHKKLEKILIYDPSVVDLRDKKGPLVVDPNVVKGKAASKPRPQPVNQTSPASQKADEVVIALLFLTDVRPGGIFKLDVEMPWINPLREPERYKAWEEEEKVRLQTEINREKAQAVIQAMDKDKKLKSARDRIIREEGTTIAREQRIIFKATIKDYQALRAAANLRAQLNGEPLKDFDEINEKLGSDPNLKKKSEAIAADYWQRSDDSRANAGEQSLKKIDLEATKFYQRHPEFN